MPEPDFLNLDSTSDDDSEMPGALIIGRGSSRFTRTSATTWSSSMMERTVFETAEAEVAETPTLSLSMFWLMNYTSYRE